MTQHNLQFVALLGSLDRRSCCRAIANTLDEIAPDDVQVTVLDTLGELPHFNEDVRAIAIPDEVRDLAGAVNEADAVVVVTPEYDASLPGVLKNALDWLGRLPQRPLAGKPVAMETASLDAMGGIRAQGHLRDVLISLDALVLNKPEVNVPFAHLRIDDGTQTVRDQETRMVVANQLRALLRLTRDRWEQAA